MHRYSIKNRVSLIIGLVVLLSTVFVTPLTTLDPINLPKMWVLSTLSFALLFIVIGNLPNLGSKNNLRYLISISTFIMSLVITLFISPISISQQVFGVYGRNSGLLTYLCFASFFIATSIYTNKSLMKYFLYGAVGSFGLNAIYGYIQASGNDFFKWSNPYAPVIGTLGNPNFAAAFLGMGVALSLSYLVAKGVDLKFKIAAGLFIAVAVYDIIKSDAQQGLIVSVLSAGLIGYFLIKYQLKNAVVRYGYLALGAVATIIGILGTLQKGPLSSILYTQSVTYRGDYWHAGLEMFKSHPWFGVGLDAYGDYYRASRTLEATLRRGPSTVSNAAHNVFIDIAATAGIFALLAYLAVIFLGFRAAWQISKRSTSFDPFFVSIFVMWVGYLVQSVISINNIALGIWGWVLPGMLNAINIWQTEEPIKKEKTKAKSATDFSGMAMVAGLVIGGVIGYLPFNADANFRHSIESGDPNKIYAAATKWPSDASRIMYAAQIFDQNKMEDKAVSLAREAVKLSPRNFDGWMYLYNSPSVSGNEKREILDRLKVLDPHNPDLKKLG